MNIAKKLVDALKSKKQPSAYDTPAVVNRIEGSTAWVRIAGGVDETPVQKTIDAKAGDAVNVRISGGKAWITGNGTAPPTDDQMAINVSHNLTTVTKTLTGRIATGEREIEETKKIAGDTNQHFWYTESGTDTGAHITEIPQEDFIADPENGGGNLLARTNGIAVRDGLTELATFSTGGVQIGQTSDIYAKIESDSFGIKQAGSNIFSVGKSAVNGLTSVRDVHTDTAASTDHYFELNHTIDIESGVTVSTVSGTPATITITGTRGVSVTCENWFDTFLIDYKTPDEIIDYKFGTGTNDKHAQNAVSESLGQAYGLNAHAENEALAYGMNSHAQGYNTIAIGDSQFVCGEYNRTDLYGEIVSGLLRKHHYPFIIGNGTSSARSNALAVDWKGNLKLNGDVYVNCDANSANGTNLTTEINGKQATITGGATSITDFNLTANRALVSNGSGKVAVSAVTSTELGYLDGVTSAIQTQLNAKAPKLIEASRTSISKSVETGTSTVIGSFSLPAGVWLLNVRGIVTSDNSTGRRAFWINRNNSTAPPASALPTYVCAGGLASGADNNYYEMNYPVEVSATTPFYVVGYQNSGSAKTMHAHVQWIGMPTYW